MAITLQNLVKQSRKVQVGEGEEDFLEVWGLSLLDIATLGRKYSKTLGKLVDKSEDTDIDWRAILMESPDFCHEVMAMTTRNKNQLNLVKQIPIGIQIKILIESWNASAIDPEMVNTATKKFLGLLSNLQESLGLKN